MVEKTPGGNADVKAAEQANKEVADIENEALAKGYRGVVPDPNPNSAYSIQSGPDSPPLVEDNESRFAQPAPVKKEK